MVNVVTYCRVSSEEQAQKDISIPAQRKALLRWAHDRDDHEVVAQFVDEGESAYAPADKRPGFCEMISFCRRHNVDHILVHKLDRFSRNREESILFKSLLRKHGVTVRSITETYDPDTPQGFLYEGMIEVINQFYSMNLATETMKGMRENAERGFVNGGRIPYGYRLEKVDVGGREHGKLVPGPEAEVAVVRRIFDLATNHGLGCKRLANLLNKEGVPGPRSRHWNASSVDAILKNRVYTGDLVWLKSKKVGRDGRERTDPEDWIITEDAHEALVDRRTFEARQALAKSRRFHARKNKSQPVTYLLSRLIHCEHCGNTFVGRRQKRKDANGGQVEYFRYYCGGYLGKGPAVCPSLPVHKEWLENFVLDMLRHKICEPGLLEELEERIQVRIDQRRKVYGTDARAVEAKLADIDGRIANYYRAIGDGLDPSVCQQHIANLTATRAELERESHVLMKEDYYDRALELNVGELRRFARAFEKDFNTLPFEAQRSIILYFVERVDIVDRKRIRVHFKVPFDNNGIRLLTDEVTGLVDGGQGQHMASGEDAASLAEVHMRQATGSHFAPDRNV